MADPNIPNIDARVAVLEQIAADTRTALIDLRDEMRTLRTDMREDMRGLREELRAVTDRLDQRMEALEKRQHTDFLWLLAVMLGGYAGMLATMAHGFRWI